MSHMGHRIAKGALQHLPQKASSESLNPACEDLQVADLNGDGRPDIVAAGRASRNVKVYLNESPR